MNFWYIEHYGESFGDHFDAKMYKFMKMVFMNFWYIKHYGARVGDDFVAKTYQMVIQCILIINRSIDA